MYSRTIARALKNCFQDSFYKSLDEESHKRAHRNAYDFDAPDAIDFDKLVNCLRDLKQGFVAKERINASSWQNGSLRTPLEGPYASATN